MVLAAFTAGCEKEIPFEGEDARTRIVMQSFLQPNNFFVVQLTESKSVLESKWDDYPPILGASVKMYKNGSYVEDLIQDPSNPDGLYYYFGLVEPGATYRFDVTHPNFEGVSGTTRVPETTPVFTAELIDTTGTEWTLEVTVNDVAPGPTHFLFELSFSQFGTNNQLAYFYSNDQFLQTPQGYFDPVDPYQYFNGEAFFTDDHFNNGTYSFRLEFYADFWTTQQFDHLDVVVKHASDDYYLYQFSGQLQQWVDGDPFAQPAQVHNNVENGIGCIGSFNPAVVRIDL